ncbi:MAG: NADPH-dependent oxidoreductase [Sphingobacteriales bacterium]|nr:MAG: NADPH-dependent oxidoreductase [Sphingobacteriales bacterium]
MNILIISGSARINSQSRRISDVVKLRLNSIYRIEADIFDLVGNPLPLWDELVGANSEDWSKLLDPVRSKMRSADAFVIVVPEWGGMVPPSLKNLFLLSTQHELGHKPALIVSISSTSNGSYPVSELRMSSYKNTKILYLPEHIIVRNVEEVLYEIGGSRESEYILKRLDNNLGLLKAYAEAMVHVRSSKLVDIHAYPYGM